MRIMKIEKKKKNLKSAFSILETAIIVVAVAVAVAAMTPSLTRKLANFSDANSTLGGGAHGRYEVFTKEILKIGDDYFEKIPDTKSKQKIRVYERITSAVIPDGAVSPDGNLYYIEYYDAVPIINADGSITDARVRITSSRDNTEHTEVVKRGGRWLFDDASINYKRVTVNEAANPVTVQDDPAAANFFALGGGEVAPGSRRIIDDRIARSIPFTNVADRGIIAQNHANLWIVENYQSSEQDTQLLAYPWERFYSGNSNAMIDRHLMCNDGHGNYTRVARFDEDCETMFELPENAKDMVVHAVGGGGAGGGPVAAVPIHTQEVADSDGNEFNRRSEHVSLNQVYDMAKTYVAAHHTHADDLDADYAIVGRFAPAGGNLFLSEEIVSPEGDQNYGESALMAETEITRNIDEAAKYINSRLGGGVYGNITRANIHAPHNCRFKRGADGKIATYEDSDTPIRTDDHRFCRDQGREYGDDFFYNLGLNRQVTVFGGSQRIVVPITPGSGKNYFPHDVLTYTKVLGGPGQRSEVYNVPRWGSIEMIEGTDSNYNIDKEHKFKPSVLACGGAGGAACAAVQWNYKDYHSGCVLDNPCHIDKTAYYNLNTYYGAGACAVASTDYSKLRGDESFNPSSNADCNLDFNNFWEIGDKLKGKDGNTSAVDLGSKESCGEFSSPAMDGCLGYTGKSCSVSFKSASGGVSLTASANGGSPTSCKKLTNSLQADACKTTHDASASASGGDVTNFNLNRVYQTDKEGNKVKWHDEKTGTSGYSYVWEPDEGSVPAGVGPDLSKPHNEQFSWSYPFSIKWLGYGEAGTPGEYVTTKIPKTPARGTHLVVRIGSGGNWNLSNAADLASTQFSNLSLKAIVKDGASNTSAINYKYYVEQSNKRARNPQGNNGHDTIVSLRVPGAAANQQILFAKGGKGGKGGFETDKYVPCYAGDSTNIYEHLDDALFDRGAIHGTYEYAYRANPQFQRVDKINQCFSGTKTTDCCQRNDIKSSFNMNVTAYKPSGFDSIKSIVKNSSAVGLGAGRSGAGIGTKGAEYNYIDTNYGDAVIFNSSAGSNSILKDAPSKIMYNRDKNIYTGAVTMAGGTVNQFDLPQETNLKGGDGSVIITW